MSHLFVRYCPQGGFLGFGQQSKSTFPEYCHVAYQIEWDEERNNIPATFLHSTLSNVVGPNLGVGTSANNNL